ncbi:MAG: peptide deformylase [Actinobacteria bacterium]|nr:peptide deformylase [Actinomycetota bacterium]MBM3712622.1 peptide deformylase [Actinomycetota bacterium]
MAVKKIRKIGDPVLRERCKEVEIIDKSTADLVKDMIDTISDKSVLGVGLAASQIGVLKRVIIVNIEGKYEAFINPEIRILDNETISEEEGCLSLYSVKTAVKRPKKILLRALNIKGDKIEFEAEEIISRIFLHEIDHLNGILFIDHLKPEDRKEFLSKITGDMIS